MNRKLLFSLASTAVLTVSQNATAAAIGTEVVWAFDLPATGNAVEQYLPAAWLTLTQEDGYVSFELDPNELSPGVHGYTSDNPENADPTKSFVKSIDFVYSGVITDESAFVYTSTVNDIQKADLLTQSNIDSSYTSTAGQVSITWKNTAGGGTSFDFSEVATWEIWGVYLEDFTDYIASTTSQKVELTMGVLSVADYYYNTNDSLVLHAQTSSNWVTGENEISTVPVPAAAWLFGTALAGLFGFKARRKNKAQVLAG